MQPLFRAAGGETLLLKSVHLNRLFDKLEQRTQFYFPATEHRRFLKSLGKYLLRSII